MLLCKAEYGNGLQYLLTDNEKYFRKTVVCNPLWYLYKKNLLKMKSSE